MESKNSPGQPVLQHGTLRMNRKYGRYDFERFDHLSSSHANVGHATFDKVNVNCRFLFKKSRWGVLGECKNPAGIIYLDLTFDQPKGCELHSATVSVTLDDEDKELQLSQRAKTAFECPVQITDYYGPKGFVGPEKTAQSTTSKHFTPTVQFAGNGFSGIGIDTKSSVTYTSRLKFSGHLVPGKGNHWAYKTLKWDLSENDLEIQPTHSNEVHTAFTFEHGGQPFLMRVEIKGKLRTLHKRIKSKLLKFSSNATDDGSVVTLIDFGNRISFKTPLDERARQLEFEMEMANQQAILMEVPDPKPVTFLNLPRGSRSSNIMAPTANLNQSQSSMADSLPPQELPASIQPSQDIRSLPTTEEAVKPTLANLAHAFVHLQALDKQIFQPLNDDATDLSSSHTLDSQETDTNQAAEGETSRTSAAAKDKQQRSTEEQLLLRLLQMPAFLAFLRVIAGLLGFLGQNSSTASDIQDERVKQGPNHSKINGASEPRVNFPHRRTPFAIAEERNTVESRKAPIHINGSTSYQGRENNDTRTAERNNFKSYKSRNI